MKKSNDHININEEEASHEESFTVDYDFTAEQNIVEASSFHAIEERPVIDCSLKPSLAVSEILSDVSEFELDDVEKLQKSMLQYEDISYWLTALINLSPTGALLLKSAANYNWDVAFDQFEGDNWTLNVEDFLVTLNHSGLDPKALTRSPYFLNELICGYVRSLRDLWYEDACAIDYQTLHPEMILKIERIRAADIESMTLQVAWELRSSGYSDLWRHLLGSDIGDMALIFSRFLEHDPASLFDGSGLAVAFKQWYADEDRSNVTDRIALEICDDFLLTQDEKQVFENQRVNAEELENIFIMPEGRPYLRGLIADVLKDPHYSVMHDQINETHFLHIIRDLEVCYVGNVPFRDAALADKIFPDYTKRLKPNN